jgi:hypothetical protein
MTRYSPARHYLSFGIVALMLAGFSAWLGKDWTPAFIPAGLFLLSAACLVILAFRPAIEIHETYLAIGKRLIPWMDIRRLDRTGWISPLIVRMTLFDDTRLILIYPGDLDAWRRAQSASSSLRRVTNSFGRKMRPRSSVCIND